MGMWRWLKEGPYQIETRGAADPTHSDLPRAMQYAVSHRSSKVTVSESLGLAAVYRAVSIHATVACTLDLQAIRTVTGVPLRNQPAIIRRPNVFESRRSFVQLTVTSLLLYGEAFWLVSNIDGLRNVEVLHPNQITIRKNEDFPYQPVYEMYAPNGKTRQLRPDEFRHLKLLRVPGALRGLGPLQAAQSAVRHGLDLEDYAGSWFNLNEMPEGVITVDKELTREQARGIAEIWKETRSEYRTGVLGKGSTYGVTQVDPKSALFVESANLSTVSIARIFGVPAVLMDAEVGSSNTYTNMVQRNQGLYDMGLRIILDEICDGFDSILGDGTSARFDTSELLALDPKTQAETSEINTRARITTINEERAARGLEPLPGGDDIQQQTTNAPTSVEAVK